MAKPDEKAQAATGQLKRLTDYVEVGANVQFEGKQVKNDELIGDDIKLLDFVAVPSTMGEGEFLVLQIEWKGEVCVTTIGAKQVVSAIKQMPKQYLPVTIKIVELKSQKTGRFFKTVE